MQATDGSNHLSKCSWYSNKPRSHVCNAAVEHLRSLSLMSLPVHIVALHQLAATCYAEGVTLGVAQQTDTFEYYATEHFRLSGVYWGATALATLGRLHLLDAEATVAWTLSCRHECDAAMTSGSHHDWRLSLAHPLACNSCCLQLR